MSEIERRKVFGIPPFRGLDKFDTWHYGTPSLDSFCDDDTANIDDFTGSGFSPVLISTIGKTPGACDRARKVIYTGDIVRFYSKGVPQNITGVVIYSAKLCAFYIRIDDQRVIFFKDMKAEVDHGGAVTFPAVEIIGDIYTGDRKQGAEYGKNG